MCEVYSRDMARCAFEKMRWFEFTLKNIVFKTPEANISSAVLRRRVLESAHCDN